VLFLLICIIPNKQEFSEGFKIIDSKTNLLRSTPKLIQNLKLKAQPDEKFSAIITMLYYNTKMLSLSIISSPIKAVDKAIFFKSII